MTIKFTFINEQRAFAFVDELKRHGCKRIRKTTTRNEAAFKRGSSMPFNFNVFVPMEYDNLAYELKKNFNA